MTPRRRSGQIEGMWLGFLGSAAALIGLVGLLVWDPERWFADRPGPLVVHCAAGIKAPVEAIARAYEAEYGVPVHLQYGASQTLLAGIEISKRGDLYLPADDTYLDLAREKDLLDETIPLAAMKPVVAVLKGNPKSVRSFDDLLRKDVRLAQANPDAAAVGKLTRAALRKKGRWEELRRRNPVEKLTVNDVANDVKVGTIDAGIVWDATVRQYPELEAVTLPELEGTTAHISVGVLRSCTQPAAALRFARFLAARDQGLKEFERHGFQTVDGDLWAEEPVLNMLAGAMLQHAIEDTINDFEKREGVEVRRVYNGCGILVAQMKTGARPDAYFACDQSFMKQVNDLFLDSVDVSTNRLVILVHKGNPHDIQSLADLGKPGLQIGVGHEKQCALGVITQQTLNQSGVLRKVMRNVVVQVPSGDMLVNQMRIPGAKLDAVVAYISNAARAGDELEAIGVDIPCALAVQPIAVGKESNYRQLTGRLLAAIRSRESKERFEANGFRWQGEGPR